MRTFVMKTSFTGVAGTHTIRLLPCLAMTTKEADIFLEALKQVLAKE